MRNRLSILLLACFLFPVIGFSQLEDITLRKEIGVNSYFATSSTLPFWLHSKQYGMVPIGSGHVLLRGALYKDFDFPQRPKYKDDLDLVDWAVGVEGLAAVTNFKLSRLSEAYAAIRWRNLEAYVGRRKEIMGLVDTTLTSGSYIWSGNALPMPKVQVSTRGYVPLGKQKRLAIMAGISHGWFKEIKYVKNHYLHQKWVYGRIGKEKAKTQLFGGMNHQVQWGGYSEYYKNNPSPVYPQTIDGYFAPNPLYTYSYILIPFLQKIIPMDKTKVPGYDAGLAVGNQLGSVDVALKTEINDFKFFLYHQHPYDFARSLYTLNNLEDGNNGLKISIPEFDPVKSILIERLNTTSQGLYRFGLYRPSNRGEYDDYFTHGQYDGWFDSNRILGTPFIQIEGLEGATFTNNRVKATSLAFQGNILPNLAYTFRHSRANHLGGYSKSYIGKQNSTLLNLTFVTKRKLTASLQLAHDQGISPKTNTGMGLQITKAW